MPRWPEMKRFCDNDGWELYKNTDHYYYRKWNDNGELLRTKVSRSPKEIPANLWKEILKKQLRVSQDYFNSKI